MLATKRAPNPSPGADKLPKIKKNTDILGDPIPTRI